MSKYIHRSIAFFVLVLSFIAYWNTTQPSIAFWDCGELTAASYGLQITHPPGAPDRKSTRLNSSHSDRSRMPSSA